MILNRIDGVSDESELPSESFAVATAGEPLVGSFSIGESVGVLHESGGAFRERTATERCS